MCEVEWSMGKGPGKKGMVSSRSGKFSMSGVMSPRHLQFEEFLLD